MAKISLLSFLLCNIFLLVAQQTTAQPPSFLFQFCLNDKGNYTLNSTYQANLNHLLTTLPTSQNDNGYGFYNVSYGKGSDQVYAVGLCRGDATPNVCRSCLNDSMHVLTDICPNQKEAVGWYDNCMLRYSNSSTLRYSNRSMLGTPVTIPLNYLWNPENVSSSNVQEYFDDLRTLLDGLKNEAASGGSLRKYATGQTKAPDFLTIYALVQCTPDLPQQQCINCLDYVYSRIPNCCSGKVGGRVVGPTCSVRYEKYLFYGSPYDPRPPSQTAPTPAPTNNTINNITEGQKSTDKSRNMIIAVVATVSGVTWRIYREGNTSKMVDPLMRVGSASEVMRCIHIGLLCVQENIENRPTMNAIVPMLNSNSLSLPLPSEPAFFMRSNTRSRMSFGSDFNSRETTKSSNHPKNDCINEASITELFPR
ncbi:hypothetical protein F8388_008040 [Cannabis sativa]|uniref:Gnk2-homologous domain-containing protein n=1 Tax=Cannabis sativa TaxID=3483 RepID=A0A7J6DXK2_CANSA|nr:hypothetical protein F8388_008040 [Cannabis sativa]